MYDITVIRGKKKSISQLINALYVFSKNLGGERIFEKYKKYKREMIFKKSRGPWPPKPPPPLHIQ